MVKTNKTEFVIWFLEFNKNIPKGSPVIERPEMRPSASITTMRDWFCKNLIEEKDKLDEDVDVRFYEWTIQSGDRNTFKVFNANFQKAMIIFGDQTIHWNFYSDHSHYVEGSAELPITWCSCCVPGHYKKIMAAVKKECMVQLRKKSRICPHGDCCRNRRIHTHRINMTRMANRSSALNDLNINPALGTVAMDNNGVPRYIISTDRYT